jgi:GMC oxidoreductase/NAD(P)-binding Rossmann-like domain
MLIDLRRASAEGPESAETLIVGSGAVGLTMAVELARAGRQVIVLEAGAQGVEAESQEFFKSARWRDQNLPGLHLGRFRALGGTTNFWGGQLLPFDPIVFEPRPWVADIAWPISREELKPYYERGYELLGIGRPLTDDAAWKRVNIVPPDLGKDIEFLFSTWAPESNLATLFDSELGDSASLCVFVNAPVVALELDQSCERVASVLVRTVDGLARRFSAERVILANGTVEIARLLKLPLADGRQTPWHSNPWLGRGFLDHIDCLAGQATPLDKRRFHDLFDNAYLDGVKYAPKLKLAAQAQREEKLVGVTGFFLTSSSFDEHRENARVLARALLRGHFRWQLMPSPSELMSMLRVALPMIVRYLRYRRIYHPADRGIQFRLMSEQVPLPQSAIHLSGKCDALGMPLVEMDWRIDGREIETMATFAERVAEHFDRHQLATIRLDPALVARDHNLLKQCNDYYHHMGMARMANTAAEGVVDRDLKVFGTRNFYVAGAAVYPTTGFANPTFTAIALGLRLANAICRGRLSA